MLKLTKFYWFLLPKTLGQKISNWFNKNAFVQFEKANFERGKANYHKAINSNREQLQSDEEQESENEELDDLLLGEVDQ